MNSLPNAVSSLPANSAPYSSYTAWIIPKNENKTRRVRMREEQRDGGK